LKGKSTWIEGDLHANSLRLIRVLIEHGIIEELSQADWNEIVTIYKNLPKKYQVYTENYHKFAELLKTHIKFKSDIQNKNITFLGDMIADRGKVDFPILYLLYQLDNHKVPYEILLSNHDLEYYLQNNSIIEEESQSKHNDEKILQSRDFTKKFQNSQPFYETIFNKTKTQLLENFKNHVVPFSIALLNNDEIIIKSHSPSGAMMLYIIAAKQGIIDSNEIKVEDFFSNKALIIETVEIVNKLWKDLDKSKFVFPSNFSVKKLYNYLSIDQLFIMAAWFRGKDLQEIKDYLMKHNFLKNTQIMLFDFFDQNNIKLLYGHDTFSTKKQSLIGLNNDFGIKDEIDKTDYPVIIEDFINIVDYDTSKKINNVIIKEMLSKILIKVQAKMPGEKLDLKLIEEIVKHVIIEEMLSEILIKVQAKMPGEKLDLKLIKAIVKHLFKTEGKKLWAKKVEEEKKESERQL
jgi:hypothetical protein